MGQCGEVKAESQNALDGGYSRTGGIMLNYLLTFKTILESQEWRR